MKQTTVTIVLTGENYDQTDLENMVKYAVDKALCANVVSVKATYQYSDVNPSGRSPFGWFV
jgi:hypothetical protein